MGGQGPQLERASHERVGNRADARPGAGEGRARAAPDPGHRRDRRRPPRGQPDRDRRRPRESPGLAGALQRVVLGGPRPRPPARRRVQPTVQRNRAARLQHRGRAAHPPRPRAHVHTPPASARRGRADARRARRRALSPGRRRQDGRDGDRRDGAPPPRPRLKTRRRGPQPHARAVLPRMAAALPPSPSPGRLERRSRRRAAPRVRRPHRGERLGRGDPHPLRVRAPPRLRRDEDRLHAPRARAAARDARALQRRGRADRQTAGEADPPRGGTAPGAAGLAARPGG